MKRLKRRAGYISVVVPTFNCAEFIPEALESITRQHRPPHEVIVVDDGSADDTESVVSELQLPQLTYVRQENRGVSAARNVGLGLATGDYLAFLDADDRWSPDILQRHGEVLDTFPEVALVFGNFVRFRHGTGDELPDQFKFYPELESLDVIKTALPEVSILAGDGFSQLVSFGEIPSFTQVTMFRRSAVGSMRFDSSLQRCEDLAFMLSASLRGRVAVNSAVLAEVRRHGKNLSANVESMPLSKRDALATLDTLVSGGERRAAFERRMVKARLDACRVLMVDGRYGEVIRELRLLLGSPGFTWQKIRGVGGLALKWMECLLRQDGQAR